MTTRPSQPPIPAEALARQARLHAALRAMEASGPNREPACLQSLRAMMAGGSPPEVDAWVEMIQRDDLVEEAGELLRTARRDAGDKALVQALASRLAPLANKAQQRRSALWQLDTRRVHVRLGFIKESDSLGFDDGDLHALFLNAFRLEGLRLVLDLGKRPRSLLSLGLSLSAGVGGRHEYLDVVLNQEPLDRPVELMARLNRRLPEGLRIQHWNPLPAYASAVGDLAQVAHWRWEVVGEARGSIEAKVADFLGASTWPWDRGASKSEAPLDLRAIVVEMHWEGAALCFTTRLGAYQAINPLKMLGAIFSIDAADVHDLIRTGVDLKPDARVKQAERFEPKLKNMYEDAVLLGGGSNIVLVDDDDDEPIRLGPQP